MKKKEIAAIIFLCLFFSLTLFLLLRNNLFAQLEPAGWIAMQEKGIILFGIILGLCIILPVVFAIYVVAWKYRSSNKKATYRPDWTGNNLIKTMWWGIPTLAMALLSVIAWNGAHQLDPYRSIASTTQPITIQVVALGWKWLFIYPQQHIATVNFIEFPVNTPIHFELTADAPMNSFWIPQLGGQMYAMAGMENQLHLIADKTGDYGGTEVEINGTGFANMRFTARVTTQSHFDTWVNSIQQSSHPLDMSTYDKLVKPSENAPVMFYAPVQNDLYNTIMMKFMEPSPTEATMHMQNMSQSMPSMQRM